MALQSTAPLISEDDIDTDARQPVADNQPESSANLPEVGDGTSGSELEGKKFRSRISPAKPDALEQRENFKVLRNWEGVVTSVEETCSDEIEIDIDNVADGDRDLVQEGAIFYLTVGIRYPRGEGPQKTTRVVFRRMPRWSSRDIERGEAAANSLWQKLHSGLIKQEIMSRWEKI